MQKLILEVAGRLLSCRPRSMVRFVLQPSNRFQCSVQLIVPKLIPIVSRMLLYCCPSPLNSVKRFPVYPSSSFE